MTGLTMVELYSTDTVSSKDLQSDSYRRPFIWIVSRPTIYEYTFAH